MQRQCRRWKWAQWLAVAAAVVTVAGGIKEFVEVIRGPKQPSSAELPLPRAPSPPPKLDKPSSALERVERLIRILGAIATASTAAAGVVTGIYFSKRNLPQR